MTDVHYDRFLYPLYFRHVFGYVNTYDFIMNGSVHCLRVSPLGGNEPAHELGTR